MKNQKITASININRLGYAKNNVKGVQRMNVIYYLIDGYRILSTDRGITINFPSKYALNIEYISNTGMQTSLHFVYRDASNK